MSSQKLGLRNNARNPASIQNDQHNDASAAQRSLNGISGVIKQIIASSTTATPLSDYAILWVVNTSASPQYLFLGKLSSAPVSVGATNGLCLPAGEGLLLHCGMSDDDKQSIAVKSSDTSVHITVLES